MPRTLLVALLLLLAAAPGARAAGWTAPVELPSRYELFEDPRVAIDDSGRGIVSVRREHGGLAVHEVDAAGRLGPAMDVPGSDGASDPVLTLHEGRVMLAWSEDEPAPSPTAMESGCCARVVAAMWRLGRAPAAARTISDLYDTARDLRAAGGVIAWTDDRLVSAIRFHAGGDGAWTVRARPRDERLQLVDVDPAPGAATAVTFLRWTGRRSTLEQVVKRPGLRPSRRVVLARGGEHGFQWTSVGVGANGHVVALTEGRRGVVRVARGRLGRPLGPPRRLAGPTDTVVLDGASVAVGGSGLAFLGLARPDGLLHALLRGRRAHRVAVPAAERALAGFNGARTATLVYAAGRSRRVEAALMDAAGRVRVEAVLADESAQGRQCVPLRMASAAGSALVTWLCWTGPSPAFAGAAPVVHLARRP